MSIVYDIIDIGDAMKKEEIKHLIWILIPLILFLYFITTRATFVFGSTIDWYNQHIVISDYFRKLFYETGSFFPNFALSLGGGQNIFYLSYYNFLSPYTILSYFFPFLKMETYYILMNLIIILVSSLLFYHWIRKKEEKQEAFLATLLFTLATPLFFHAHRHFMFMNYMPFLLLGLLGIDQFLEEGKSFKIILAIFLVTLTSYYYALPTGFCFLLYYIYQVLKRREKLFQKRDFHFILRVFLGVLMASFLTFPTLYVILSGERSGSVSLLSLLLPNFDFSTYLITSYGLGLTAVFLYALIFHFCHPKKEVAFLSITIAIVSIFPVFLFLFNGFLYARAKILIPLLPLCILLILEFVKRLQQGAILLKQILLLFTILFTITFFTNTNTLLPWFLIIETVLLVWFLYRKEQKVLYCGIILVAICVNLGTNFDDSLLTKKDLSIIHQQESLMEKIPKDGFYRAENLSLSKYNTNFVFDTSTYLPSIYSSVQNQIYRDFLKETMFYAFDDPCDYVLNQSNNPILQILLGVRYIISDGTYVPIGYEQIDTNVYQNKHVLPIIYATKHQISKDDYLKLTKLEKMEALLNYAIVDHGTNQYPTTHIQQESLEVENIQMSDNVSIAYEEGKIIITSVGDGTIDLTLKKEIQGSVLFLEFDLLNQKICSEGGLWIEINGIKNLLSCKDYLYYNKNEHFEYSLSSNTVLKELHIVVGEGIYELANIQTHSLQEKYLYQKEIDAFVPKTIEQDHLMGTIDVKEDGYLVIQIPYDKGFQIKLNNQEVAYELINESFLGVPVTKGFYHLEITYRSPYFSLGIIASFIGLLGSSYFIWKEQRYKK